MVVRCHAVYEGTKYPLLPPPLLPAHSAVLCSGTQPCFRLMELMQKPGSCWNNVIFSCFTFINMEHRLPGRYQLPAFVAAQTRHTAVAPACSPWHPAEHAAPAARLRAAPGAVSSTHPWLQLCPLPLSTLGMALGSAPYVSAPYEWQSRGILFMEAQHGWVGRDIAAHPAGMGPKHPPCSTGPIPRTCSPGSGWGRAGVCVLGCSHSRLTVWSSASEAKRAASEPE